jgi:hypothetical protein
MFADNNTTLHESSLLDVGAGYICTLEPICDGMGADGFPNVPLYIRSYLEVGHANFMETK